MLDLGLYSCQSHYKGSFMNEINSAVKKQNQKKQETQIQSNINGISNIIMVSPTYFRVDYEINPFMRDESGALKKVNSEQALQQSNFLKSLYQEMGLSVIEIPPSKDHPDMVFTANQLLPFKKDGQTQFILSHMASTERAGEVLFFKNWAQQNNYKTHQLSIGPFEGMGDALWNWDQSQLYLGYGFRTHLLVAKELEKITEKKVIPLKLISPHFYHLDTCLAFLRQGEVAYVKEAFAPESIEVLKEQFENLIEIPFAEATGGLACNLFCPDQKTVLIDESNVGTISMLRDRKYEIKAVDTSEFRKSGGSVFCLKLAF